MNNNSQIEFNFLRAYEEGPQNSFKRASKSGGDYWKK